MASEVMPSGACVNTGPAAAQPPQRPSVTRIGSASIWRSAWSARRPVFVSTHSKHNPVGRAARISRMVAMTNRSRHRRRGCIGLWSNGVSVLPSDRSSGPSTGPRATQEASVASCRRTVLALAYRTTRPDYGLTFNPGCPSFAAGSRTVKWAP